MTTPVDILGGSKLTPVDRAFLNRIGQIAELHLHDPDFTIAEFCRMAGYSRSQMYRKIGRLTGLSASRFIRSLRPRRAVQMLKEEPLCIGQRAEKTGQKSVLFWALF